jgi:hypothetical protein
MAKAFSRLLAVSAALLGAPDPGQALTDVFVPSGTTLTLQANCMTDSTILVPNGFTLDATGRRLLPSIRQAVISREPS